MGAEKIYPVTIFTQQGALQFQLVSKQEDFMTALAAAMEQGTAIVDTVDGTKLIMNAINVVAIEIGEAENSEETPPIL